ncbi:tetratricopeptide repeat protein [Leptospira terpstrae]|uniref:tetratricopeptide repeat protein n=1 Tax=Leptospira terpstrae TaxID=293075 RepID=UPI003D02AA47
MRQNSTVLPLGKRTLFTFGILLFMGILPLTADRSVSQIFANERTKQGDLLYQKAKEFLEDRNHYQSVESCKSFLLLYPSHPKTREVRKVLSSNFRMTGDILALAENELKIYKEFPNTEEGLESYLISGKAFVRMGREDKAYQIFQDIIKNTYSSKIAQEAELELTQMEILGESKNK